jgi:hypothetical protein
MLRIDVDQVSLEEIKPVKIIKHRHS